MAKHSATKKIDETKPATEVATAITDDATTTPVATAPVKKAKKKVLLLETDIKRLSFTMFPKAELTTGTKKSIAQMMRIKRDELADNLRRLKMTKNATATLMAVDVSRGFYYIVMDKNDPFNQSLNDFFGNLDESINTALTNFRAAKASAAAIHASNTSETPVTKGTDGSMNTNKKAKIVFRVAPNYNWLKEHFQRVSLEAAVALTAGLEYICSQYIKVAVHRHAIDTKQIKTIDGKQEGKEPNEISGRITNRDLSVGFRTDSDLAHITGSIRVYGAGALPNPMRKLGPKKKQHKRRADGGAKQQSTEAKKTTKATASGGKSKKEKETSKKQKQSLTKTIDKNSKVSKKAAAAAAATSKKQPRIKNGKKADAAKVVA